MVSFNEEKIEEELLLRLLEEEQIPKKEEERTGEREEEREQETEQQQEEEKQPLPITPSENQSTIEDKVKEFGDSFTEKKGENFTNITYHQQEETQYRQNTFAEGSYQERAEQQPASIYKKEEDPLPHGIPEEINLG